MTYRERRGRIKPGAAFGHTDSRGYVVGNVCGVKTYAHQIAFILMTNDLPSVIDHIDGNPSNNRWDNLRASDHSCNVHNQRARSATGYRGVVWNGYSFTANAWDGERSVYLGSYDTAQEASSHVEKFLRAKYGDYLSCR